MLFDNKNKANLHCEWVGFRAEPTWHRIYTRIGSRTRDAGKVWRGNIVSEWNCQRLECEYAVPSARAVSENCPGVVDGKQLLSWGRGGWPSGSDCPKEWMGQKWNLSMRGVYQGVLCAEGVRESTGWLSDGVGLQSKCRSSPRTISGTSSKCYIEQNNTLRDKWWINDSTLLRLTSY